MKPKLLHLYVTLLLKWTLDLIQTLIQFLVVDGSLTQSQTKDCFEQKTIQNDINIVVAHLVVVVTQATKILSFLVHFVDIL